MAPWTNGVLPLDHDQIGKIHDQDFVLHRGYAGRLSDGRALECSLTGVRITNQATHETQRADNHRRLWYIYTIAQIKAWPCALLQEGEVPSHANQSLSNSACTIFLFWRVGFALEAPGRGLGAAGSDGQVC